VRYIRYELGQSAAVTDIVNLLILNFGIVRSTAYQWLKECRESIGQDDS
jgi:hypothetical protein